MGLPDVGPSAPFRSKDPQAAGIPHLLVKVGMCVYSENPRIGDFLYRPKGAKKHITWQVLTRRPSHWTGSEVWTPSIIKSVVKR